MQSERRPNEPELAKRIENLEGLVRTMLMALEMNGIMRRTTDNDAPVKVPKRPRQSKLVPEKEVAKLMKDLGMGVRERDLR